MAVLGGYSVLGDSVLSPLATLESTEICSSLKNALREIRLSGTGNASHQAWMNYFWGTGNKVEHEAFLVLWLSRFVLTHKHNYIPPDLFPIAIRLSKGIKIALARAVLASIYRDFRLLNRLLIDSSTLGDDSTNSVVATPLSSPLQIVLLWAHNRFRGEPRLGWHYGLPKLDVVHVRKDLDSAGECIIWRPYDKGSMFSKLYKENVEWVLVVSNMDEELESYSSCLRVSALVGLDCIEQYFPHRIARQFGFDQDIPAYVTRSNWSPDDAWRNYIRPITDVKLYIPPHVFESGVTLRYMEWLNGSFYMDESCNGPRISQGGEKDCRLLVLAVPLTCYREEEEDYIVEDEMMITDLVCYKSKSADVSEPKDTLTSLGNDEKKSSWDDTIDEVPELDIEVRISILEKVVATLKAAKLEGKLRKKC